MDDLNDLIWGNSGVSKTKTPQNNSTSLNSLRGHSNTPSTTKTSPILSSANKIHSTPIASTPNYFSSSINSNSSESSAFNKSPDDSPRINPVRNNTEAFDKLHSFNKKPTSLSLIEQLKLREQERRRKEEEENQRYDEHYDQSNFWDSLESKSNNNQSTANRNGTSDSQKTINQQVDLFDELLMPSSNIEKHESNPNKAKNKFYSQPNASLGSGNNRPDIGILSNTTNKISASDDLLDFGIFEQAPKSSQVIVEDNIDPFDTKSVSTLTNASSTVSRDSSESPIQRNIHKDHLVAQIVDMGFSASEAETALAATSSGEDISSAIEILFQQREAENQVFARREMNRNLHKTRQPNFRKFNTAQAYSPYEDDDDDSEPGSIPRSRNAPKKSHLDVAKSNMYGRSVSDGESSDLSSSSSNFYQSKEKLISTASEFGLTALKKASTLYKQSKEKVNKAIEEIQRQQGHPDGEVKRPRWMQDQYFQDSDDYSSEKYGDSTDQLNEINHDDNKFQEKYGKMEGFGKFRDVHKNDSGDETRQPEKISNKINSISREIRDRLVGKNPSKVDDRYGNLERYVDSDSTSNENLGHIGINEKLSKLEKFQDSYDETSSEDDQPVNRNRFGPTPSRSQVSNFDSIPSQKQMPKPPKPAVPSRKTKPDIESTYISPRRRPVNNPKNVSHEPSPTIKASPKPAPTPRPVIHASSEQLSSSDIHKNKGNEVFKLGQFDEAEKFYSLAIESLPSKHLLLVVLYNNRATTRLKIGNNRGCVEDCTFALELIDDVMRPPPPGVEIDLKGQYAKALLRRASAYESMEKYDRAKDDYQQLINSDPSSSNKVSDGLRRCQKAIMMSNGQSSANNISNMRVPEYTSSSSTAYNNVAIQPDSQNTFGTPLNEFGFVDPNVNVSIPIPVDPNNPAVKKLRDHARQQDFEESERLRHKDDVDQRISQWKLGKETNVRALIGSLETILWDELRWKKVGLHELVTPAQVKIQYKKAIGKVHPDKLNVSTTIEQRLLANGVFSILNDAWDVFRAQNNL
ncbi:3542_t:CDS:2 [Acaulospora morrowiae]|uniref:3542_t:CDS:1 n=1 Tax=Acaulospora morrowiae TaxID=94023 RepID=A0A9N9BL18_9GLOM|nr:3542_t:CDS:2 [Acaulospora morrowiae]